jgi:alpha-beta hydrolase superfamily lysophospholipase
MSATPSESTFELAVGEPQRRLVGRIRGAATEGETPRPLVVLVHGYLASMDFGFMPHVAQALDAGSIATVAFDHSGSGHTHGPDGTVGPLEDEAGFATNTYARELEDLAAVTEFVRCGAIPGVDPRRLGLFGHSSGAAMALVHASETSSYRALCSWAPGSHIARYEPARLLEWQRDGFLVVPLPDGRRWQLATDLFQDFTHNAARYDLVRAGVRFAGAWLLVSSANDRAVPLGEVTGFVERVNAERRVPAIHQVIPGGGHNFGPATSEPQPSSWAQMAIHATVQFFREHL